MSHSELNENRLFADGHGTKPARLHSTADNASSATDRTAQIMAFLMDFEDHRTFFKPGAHVFVALDIESMIQEARGHEGSPFW